MTRQKQKYFPKEIEKKWQEVWEKQEIYRFKLDKEKENYYNLVELPYPSGDLHLGHWFTFVNADAHARFMRMSGKNVFFPNGFDAFGLPAENAAIKRNIHPKDWTMKNIQTMKTQFATMGTMIDWSHEVITCLPEYYSWNQWIFIKMFEKGIAYRGKTLSNWCPVDQTVLANEHVEDGKCWRCGSQVEQKEVEQWFLKITALADDLLWDNTKEGKKANGVDWPKSVREGQNNWIGKSVGAEIVFPLADSKLKEKGDLASPRGTTRNLTRNYAEPGIKVFTTRPDTLFGATFMVVAPEHPILKEVKDKAVEDYIEKSKKKTELERKEQKEKTGVFTGLKAIHPLTKEEIPVWVADYVLWGYGTGAIMAVPAHDERDFAFAAKYSLPIREVIKPETKTYVGYVRKEWSNDFQTCINGLVELGAEFRLKNDEEAVYVVSEKKMDQALELAKRSVRIGSWHDFVGEELIIVFGDGQVEHIKKFDYAEKIWQKMQSLEPSVRKYKNVWEMLFNSVYREDVYFVGRGKISNSNDWNGWTVPDNIGKIIDWLEEKSLGKRRVEYHLHDWSVSRQRYWGTPVPMIHCPDCGIVPVPLEDLPVELPYEVDYTPKGKPPLATAEEWLKVKCPKCGGEAKRDAETLDTFFDSSWYYYRYMDPSYDKLPFDPQLAKKQMPVDIYFGGAEHTLGHTLYARFFTKFFKELDLVTFSEFAKKRIQHGVILGPDGYRMSKSRGNVVNPDDVVAEYGADTVRLYLAFMMPFEATAPWNPTAISGIYRFLKRIWDLQSSVISFQLSDSGPSVSQSTGLPGEALAETGQLKTERLESENRKQKTDNRDISKKDLYMMHKTIKKVGEDLRDIQFNTAVAFLMEWLNHLASKEKVSLTEYKTLLLLLAPFAPHITEEIWSRVAGRVDSTSLQTRTRSGPAKQDLATRDSARHLKSNSIHLESWPSFEEEYLIEDSVEVVVQVNGKLRARIKVQKEDIHDQHKVQTLASENSKVAGYIDFGKNVKKVIYVPGKILNFVVG